MTTQVVDAPVVAPSKRDRAVAWALLAVLAGLLGCALVLGEREADLEQLRAEVAAGDVTEIRHSPVIDGRGWGGVTIRWEQHGLTYVTSLTHASNENQARRARQSGSDEVVTGEIADAVTVYGGRVQVTDSTIASSRPSFHAYGFVVPGWIALGGFAVIVATLLVVGSREPWRATSWGWAWLILGTPFGAVAFLLVGGPTGLFPPRPGSRRLTGGWALLLAAVLSGGASTI